jgi:enoyl-CoA hydratase/carnithine racemase
MVHEDILFSVENQIAFITLNRPQALHALNLAMIKAIYQQLLQWLDDDAIHVVVLKATEAKAFCAGGDVRWLYATGKIDIDLALSFF